MKKTVTFLFLLSLSVLTSCNLGPNYVSSDKRKPPATVVMPVFYEESAPYKGVSGRTGIRVKKYLVSTVFQNRETKEKMTTGLAMTNSFTTPPSYIASNFAPGRYDLVSITVGGMIKNYDQEKCGRIGFDVNSGETLVLKGVKPAAITAQGLFRGRVVSLVTFETLPKDFIKVLKAGHPHLEIRVIAPASDNPVAFRKCIDETAPKFSTLMGGIGN